MKTEEILKLKDAGFSNEDIIKFASAVDQLPEAPQEINAEASEAAAPSAVTSKPETTPAWAESLTAQISALTRTIQATNARNVSMPTPEKKDASQILGDVLNAAASKERK